MSQGVDHEEPSYPRARPYGRSTIAFHLTGVALHVALLSWCCFWLATRAGQIRWVSLALALATVAGLFLADALSGVLHWMFDTWFDEDHGWLHRMVAMVREHHLAPLAVFNYPLYHDAGTLSWIMSLVAGPLVVPVLTAAGPPSATTFGAVWTGVVMCLNVLFMLEYHKCGHRPSVRGVVGALQRCHLVLSPWHHGQHHRSPHTVRYCILNGWANYVLDATRLFRGLEWLISRLTGAVPRASDRAWRAKYGSVRDCQGQAQAVARSAR